MTGKSIIKTVHLREASFSDSDNALAYKALSDMLAQAKQNYTESRESFEYGIGFDCLVVSNAEDNEHQYLHIVTFEAGTGAAVIGNLELQSQNLVDEVDPPKNNEFIKSQLFLICSKNNIAWISNNRVLRQGSVTSILTNLLSKFCPGHPTPKLFLTAPVNPVAFDKLMKEGIKQIELKSTAFKQQLEYAKNGGQVPATLCSMLKKGDISDEDIKASANLRQQIILSPGRHWEKTKVILEKITNSLVNDDDVDGFAIRTKGGDRLTSEKMTISGEVSTLGNSQTLNTEKTFKVLKPAFQNMLKKS